MMLFVLIVYIVDDDSGMWMLFVWLFELVGIVFEGFVNVVDFFVCFDVNLFVCFVFDVWMLEKSGFDVQVELNVCGVMLLVIFVSGYGDILMLVCVLQNGVIDFVEKLYNLQQMFECVQCVLWFVQQWYVVSQCYCELCQWFDVLIVCEKEVLCGVVDGKGSKQIVLDLLISVKMVDVYCVSIKEKFGVMLIVVLVCDVMVVWGDDGELL